MKKIQFTRVQFTLKYILLLLVTAFSGVLCAATAPIATDIIATSNGKVRGLQEESGVSAFKGIRYGAPPTGNQRFLPPQAPQYWDGVKDASSFGAPAMQMYNRASVASELSMQLATVFTTASDIKIDNEDCLFLNLWTPANDDKKRPVMVWLHGGGFAYGSGAWPVYDGANLASKGDVVVVTVNHRLNVFGYLNLADIGGAKYVHSGNAGMLDLVLALQWVRDNAAAFGGDPDNVTIMGESGGGVKVSHLLAMPRAKGLFHKAIIQSGPGLTATSFDAAHRTAMKILAALDIDKNNLEKLSQIPAQDILDAVIVAGKNAPGGRGFRLSPIVDGDVLPGHPFTPKAPDISKNVPVLIGWNKDEMTIFNTSASWFGKMNEEELTARVKSFAGDKGGKLIATYKALYPEYSSTYLYNIIAGDSRMFIGSVQLAQRKAALKGAAVYQYYLTWETPVGNGVFKSPHTLDMPFMFNNVDKSVALTGDTPESRALERQMSSSWIAFAHNGDPNNHTVPNWPAYDKVKRSVMVFNVKSKIVEDPKQRARKILENL